MQLEIFYYADAGVQVFYSQHYPFAYLLVVYKSFYLCVVSLSCSMEGAASRTQTLKTD